MAILKHYFPLVEGAITKALAAKDKPSAAEQNRLKVIQEFAAKIIAITNTPLHHILSLRDQARAFAVFMTDKVSPASGKPIVAMENYDSYADCGLTLLELAVNSPETLHIALLIKECLEKAVAAPDELIEEFPGSSLLKTRPLIHQNVIGLIQQSNTRIPYFTGRITAFIQTWKTEEINKATTLLDSQKPLAQEAAPLLEEVKGGAPLPSDKTLSANIAKIQDLLSHLEHARKELINAKNAASLCPGYTATEVANTETKQCYQAGIETIEQLKAQLQAQQNKHEESLLKNVDKAVEKARALKAKLQQQEVLLKGQEKIVEITQQSAADFAAAPPTPQKKGILASFKKRKASQPAVGWTQSAAIAKEQLQKAKSALQHTNETKAVDQAAFEKLCKRLDNFAQEQTQLLQSKLLHLQSEVAACSFQLEEMLTSLTQATPAELAHSMADLISLHQILDNIDSYNQENHKQSQQLLDELAALKARVAQYPSLGLKPPDLTTLDTDCQKANADANAEATAPASLLRRIIDPKTCFAHPLYIQIAVMRAYGESLKTDDEEKSKSTVLLANLLTLKANSYFCLSKEKQKTAFPQFHSSFMTLLHSKDDLMSEHRAYWKIVVANIAIALTGLGLLAVSAKLIYSKLSTHKATLFFDYTKRQELVGHVEEQASQLTPPAA